MEKYYFRADRRDFSPGEPITTAREFMDKHPEFGKQAEKILSELQPDRLPDRADCLMVFEDEDCARRHWAKMSNAKLYLVEIPDEMIRHRGDMKLVDEMGVRLSVGEDATDLAQMYWEERYTDSPCVEVLAECGTIVKLLGSNEDRIAEFKQRFLSIKPDDDDEFDLDQLFSDALKGSDKP